MSDRITLQECIRLDSEFIDGPPFKILKFIIKTYKMTLEQIEQSGKGCGGRLMIGMGIHIKGRASLKMI